MAEIKDPENTLIITLKGGEVVRLKLGDMAQATVFSSDPAAQAARFEEQGFEYLHVVDLDGAFAGASVNGGAVETIVAAFAGKVQVGGGIRDRAGVDRWLALGVSRVIIGTAALKDPEFVKKEETLGAVVVNDKRVEPAEHKKFVAAEVAKWGPVIKAAGQYAD